MSFSFSMIHSITGRVMVFGTYDVFHPGHEYFIREAMKRSVELSPNAQPDVVVVIARDVTVKKIKPLLRNTEEQRRKVIQSAFPNLQVVLGDEEDYMKVIRDYQPEKVCLGYDQKGFSEALVKHFPEIEIERTDSYFPEKYKSSKMD